MRNRRSAQALVVAVLSVAAGATAYATPYDFNRLGGNNNLDDALNWAGGVAPPVAVPGGDTTDLRFDIDVGGSGGSTNNPAMRQGYAVSSLYFGPNLAGTGGSGTVSFTSSTTLISGTTAHLTLGTGGITVDSTIPVSVTRGTSSQTADLILNGNQTWAVNNNGTLIINRPLSGTGRITKTGTGLANLSTTATFSGGITVSQGTLQLSNSANTLSGGVTVANGARLFVSGSTQLPAANVLTMQGGSTLHISSTSNATISNSVSVTGDFTVGTGAQTGGRATFAGTLDFNGGTRTVTIAGLGNGGRYFELTAGKIVNGSVVFQGAGPGVGPVRIGSGAVVTGDITLRNVTMFLSNGAATSAANNLTLDAGGVINLWDPGSTSGGGGPMRSPTIGNLSGTGSIINGSTNVGAGNATVTSAGVGTSTFAGQIRDSTNAGTATTGLTLSSGTLTIGAAQTYTGPTTVNGGRLNLAAGATLASTIAVNNGATLDLSAAYPAGYNVAAGGVTFVASGSVIGTVNVPADSFIRNNTTTDHSTAVVVNGGTFVKSNSSTVTFNGTLNASVLLNLTGGRLVAGAASVLDTTNVTVAGGALLDVSARPGGLVIPAANSLSMNGVVLGNVTNNGAVNISAFTTNQSGTNNGDNTYPANISGPGSLNKSAGGTGTAGTSTFTGNLTFTGNVNVSGGTLVARTPLRPVTGSLVVTGPGVFTVLDSTGYASASSAVVAGEFSSITVGSNGQTGVSTLALTPTARPANRASLVVTSSLTIATDAGSSLSGFVDLGTGDLLVKGGASQLSTVNGYVAAWLGSGGTPVGLGSTAAVTHTRHAVVANTAGFELPLFSTFDGVSVNTSDLLVRYTYVGDTNLDGTLDARDFNAVLNGWSNGLSGWQNGDVNYDGVVNAGDFTEFMAAYTAGLPSLGSPLGGDGTGGSIPEPAAVSLLAPAAMLLTRRRR